MRRTTELQVQRALLRRRIADERAMLGRALQPVARSLDMRSRVDGLLHQASAFATRNPLAVAAAAAALVIFKPRLLLRVAQRGLLLWRTWRSVRSLLPASVLARAADFLR